MLWIFIRLWHDWWRFRMLSGWRNLYRCVSHSLALPRCVVFYIANYTIGSGGGCTDSSLVSCSGFDFCCAAGETCSLDANGNAQCNGVATGNGDGGGNDNSDSGTTTTTTTTYYNPPTGTTSTAQFTVVNTNTVATVRTTSTTSATLSSKTTTTTPFSSPSLLPATTSSDTTPNGAGRLVIEGSMSLFALSVGLLFV